MAKIVSVEAKQLFPKVIKEAWADDEYVWPSQLPSFIVKVTADTGATGFGEITSQPWYYGETAGTISSFLALYDTALRGADPANLSLAHRIMQAQASGGMPGSRGARAAVDMALYDLVGKMLGVPVYTLLGGAYRTRLELLGNFYHKTPEAMARAATEAVAQGFRGLKVKVGDVLLAKGWSRANFETELDKLEAALAAVPGDVYIDADANQGWLSPKWTVNALSRFSDYHNLSIEQPLPYDDLEGAAFVRAHTTTPVVLDESVWSPEAVLRMVRMGACDRIVLKLIRVGGFHPASQIIAIAEAAGIGVSFDTSPSNLLGDTAVAHAAAATRTAYPVDCEGHISYFEPRATNRLSGGIRIDNGIATLPDAPGLGVDVDWDAIDDTPAGTGAE